MNGAPMRKIVLSAAVIAASGAYVWSQVGSIRALPAGADRSVASSGEALATPQTAALPVPPAAPAPAAVAQAPAEEQPLPPKLAESASSGVVAPAPQAQVKLASAKVAATGGDPYHAAWTSSHMTMFGMIGMGFSDGTYRGPVVDAYYGVVQVQAIIKHGRIDSIDVLRWPADRSTSVSINEHALPVLRQEAISAQSAEVDIISGATLLSNAFIQSLGAALEKARA